MAGAVQTECGEMAARGVILYDGPSQLDGSPIVCIATGIDGSSLNHKTGPMVQTWILPRDVAPEDAVRSGHDSAVCGDCSLRGVVAKLPNGEQVNRFRSCYVFVGQAPQNVWDSYRAGNYSQPSDFGCLLGQFLRIGSYGDPCAVPFEIWQTAVIVSEGHTGYTHQWRDDRFQGYRDVLMASVESFEDAALAHSKGWRTFRVALTGELPAVGEFHCPASAEENYRLTCQQCRACSGGNPDRPSVLIWPHGPPASVKSFYRLVSGASKQIEHRHTLNEYDCELIAVLNKLGTASASDIAGRVAHGTQGVATRLWHLRQMGLVRRVSRGQYQATEAAE
jgi:hypothetical protein